MNYEECSICLEPVISIDKYYLVCGHVLHEKCRNNLLVSNCPSKDKCPICREKILINDMDDYKEDEWRGIINRNSVSVNENIPLPIVQALMFSIPRLPEDFHPS